MRRNCASLASDSARSPPPAAAARRTTTSVNQPSAQLRLPHWTSRALCLSTRRPLARSVNTMHAKHPRIQTNKNASQRVLCRNGRRRIKLSKCFVTLTWFPEPARVLLQQSVSLATEHGVQPISNLVPTVDALDPGK